MTTRYRRRRLALAAILMVSLCEGSSAFAQVNTTYDYDPQGQVTSVTRAGATTTYSYDAAANRTGVTASGALALRSAPVAAAASSHAPADAEAVLARMRASKTATAPALDTSAYPRPDRPPPALVNGVVVAYPPVASPSEQK